MKVNRMKESLSSGNSKLKNKAHSEFSSRIILHVNFEKNGYIWLDSIILMRYLFYLIIGFICVDASAQSYYDKADSLVRLYISELPTEHSGKFDTILAHRIKNHFADSIDGKKYDYVYIEESFCFFEGRFDSYYDYYTSDSTESDKEINRLKKMMEDSKHVQKQNYKVWEISDHDRKCRKKSKYREICEKEIETTYSIVTIIDKTTGGISVTLKYPPKKGKCRAIYMGGGKC